METIPLSTIVLFQAASQFAEWIDECFCRARTFTLAEMSRWLALEKQAETPEDAKHTVHKLLSAQIITLANGAAWDSWSG